MSRSTFAAESRPFGSFVCSRPSRKAKSASLGFSRFSVGSRESVGANLIPRSSRWLRVFASKSRASWNAAAPCYGPFGPYHIFVMKSAIIPRTMPSTSTAQINAETPRI